ncbi:MAG: alpha/beta hydrolase, partial [Planctomycetota bacterium]|nr:alpha/beta hydrolase [Planctomycetota bacterium]
GMNGSPATVGEGPWHAVAVFRAENDRSSLAVEGGIYSDPVKIEGGGINAGAVALTCNTQVSGRSWKPHKNLHLVEERSELLSKFYGRDILHGACVIVPDDYNPSREEPYPVVFWIGGFGSDHYGGRFMKSLFAVSDYDDQICRVVLNAQFHGGHHVFANSANTGPRMTAFISEFVPYLESNFNLGGSPSHRYLAGHSSGGWAAMWLQVKNPEFFDGAWPLAPDPIDFHYFQTLDIYADDANMYTDDGGNLRPIARNGTIPTIYAKSFVAMDDVIKDGGQIGSFEWVFSPQGADGRPKKMFDRETGRVVSDVAQSWRQYDIRNLLEENWEELSPKLRGKLHIIAGEFDTFYLVEAVQNLKEFFEQNDFDASVQVIKGGNHGTAMRPKTIREMDEEIAERLDLVNNQGAASESGRR